MKLRCLACGHTYEVPEGTNLPGLRCPQCRSERTHFTEAQFLRFEKVENESYSRAVEFASKGFHDAAFKALAEALQQGCDPELIDNDPAFAKLRTDPRWSALRP